MRENFMWLIRLDAIYYVLLAFTLSFAGYEAEIMRGAFLSVPRGELEAARAFGMSPWKVASRVWFPRAVLQVLPTLTGEVIGQLKSMRVFGWIFLKYGNRIWVIQFGKTPSISIASTDFANALMSSVSLFSDLAN